MKKNSMFIRFFASTFYHLICWVSFMAISAINICPVLACFMEFISPWWMLAYLVVLPIDFALFDIFIKKDGKG